MKGKAVLFMRLFHSACHLTGQSIILHLLKIKWTATGISLQTQILLAFAGLINLALWAILWLTGLGSHDHPLLFALLNLADLVLPTYTLTTLLLDTRINADTVTNTSNLQLYWQQAVCLIGTCLALSIVLTLTAHIHAGEAVLFVATWNVVLHIVAMLPQLWLFRTNRQVAWQVQGFIFAYSLSAMMGLGFFFYYWTQTEGWFGWAMNFLVVFQALAYADFFIYQAKSCISDSSGFSYTAVPRSQNRLPLLEIGDTYFELGDDTGFRHPSQSLQ